jgi:hypothetical protein
MIDIAAAFLVNSTFGANDPAEDMSVEKKNATRNSDQPPKA